MKIEQIAFGAREPAELISKYSQIGINIWTTDIVEAEGFVFGKKCYNIAELYFNYQLGYEFEILKYRKGDNWHNYRDVDLLTVFPSHKGLHVDKKELAEWKIKMKNVGVGIAQEVYTISHINPVIAGKRKYHYVVFDSKKHLGFDLKLIERIDL